MRFAVFLILFACITSVSGFAQADLENQVILSLLNEGWRFIPEYKKSKTKGWVKKYHRRRVPDFVLSQVTRDPLSMGGFDTNILFQKGVLAENEREILADFCARNIASLRIDVIPEWKDAVVYLSSTERKNVFAKQNDWHTYYGRFGLRPFVTVSRPGFNKSADKALMYITYSLGNRDGAGFYLVLKKTFTTWRVVGRLLVWVA